MKKFLSLLLCFLFSLGLLVGCQREEIPEKESLPFEKYGSYRILNITEKSLSLDAGGTKASYHDALKSVSSPKPVGTVQTNWSFGGKSYKLDFQESVFVPRGDYSYHSYGFDQSGIPSDASIKFTQDGKLITLSKFPLALPDISNMSDDEIKLMFETIFAEQFDFSKYTEFSSVRATDDSIQLEWHRTLGEYGEYTLTDNLSVFVMFGEFEALYAFPPIEIPKELSVPSFDAMRPDIGEYLEDHFEGTGKNIVSFKLQSGSLTRVEGCCALDLYVAVDWRRADQESEYPYGELVRVIVLIE